MQIKVGIIGYTGNIGKQLKTLINEDSNFRYIGGINSQNFSTLSLEKLFTTSDIIIDFSNREIIENLLDLAILSNTPLVIGTTGYNQEQIKKILQTSKKIPIFHSSNFSVGIYVIKKLLKTLCSNLADKYAINLLEWHQSEKKDFPSGTAKDILNEISKYTKKDVETISIRAGKVFCEHNLSFTNDAERISLTHEIYDKKNFAKTALDAALFILSQEIGYYEMEDLLKGLTCSR